MVGAIIIILFFLWLIKDSNNCNGGCYIPPLPPSNPIPPSEREKE